MGSYDFFKGFLSGLHAGNYDITHVFVDNFTKMLSEVSEPQIAEFLAWLNDFSERENIQFTLSLSMDPAVTGGEITKYDLTYGKTAAPNIRSGGFLCASFGELAVHGRAVVFFAFSVTASTSTFTVRWPKAISITSPTFTSYDALAVRPLTVMC